jgi:Domain of unknown function (DUF4136)
MVDCLRASSCAISASVGSFMKPKLHDVEKKATLVIDLVNQSNQQMVWRATAGDTLADTSDENLKKLNKAMNKMFAHFPPKQT